MSRARLALWVTFTLVFIFTISCACLSRAQSTPFLPALIPKGLEGVDLTAEQVNQAIDRGAAFLWGYLKKQDLRGDNNKLGQDQTHILCALALVHCGWNKKDAEFDAALRHMLDHLKPASEEIYNSGLLNMLVEDYGDPQFFPLLQESTRYLFESQGPQGRFAYAGCKSEFGTIRATPPEILQIIGGVPPTGADVPALQHLLKPKDGYDGDNSVSQFACLGLLSGTRGGIHLPDDTWKLLLKAYRERQAEDGGWGYNGPSGAYGSMTCAGICSVAICRFELGEKDVGDDPAIKRGVNWLDANFSVMQNPKHSDFVFYYLYSLERVGQILQTEFIGAHEWYPLGAKQLVGNQKPDGSWMAENGNERDPRLATSFALLFLTRATPHLRHEAKPGEMGTLRTSVVSPPPVRLYVILDCSGSMLDEIDGKQKFQIARGAVSKLFSSLPPETLMALRVYGHRKTALDKGCDEDTELLIPMGKLDKDRVADKLQKLRARGKTPLALSLQLAKKDIGDVAETTEFLLLTDGGEDTMPRKDPVAAVADLTKGGKIHLDIVGFDVENHPEWTEQLQKMAKQANGNYWPAAREKDLDEQILSAIFKKPDQFVVVDKDDKEAARGNFGDSRTLAPGQYVLKTRFGEQDYQRSFWINGGEQTGVNFNMTNVLISQKATSPKPSQ